MKAVQSAEPTIARTMLHDPARRLVGLAALLGLLVVTVASAPAGFWLGAPRAWVADILARREVTVAQPLAIGFIAAAILCAAGAGVWIWRAPLERRWLGLVLGFVPLLALSVSSRVGVEALVVVVLAFTTWATGRLMMSRAQLPGASATERTLLEAGVGLGMVVFWAFGFGLLGWLTPLSIFGLVALVMLLTARSVLRGRPLVVPLIPSARWQLGSGEALLLISLLLLLQVVVPYVVAPEIAYDAVYYHLTIVGEFVRRGAVVQMPNIFASTFPLLPHLAYTVAAVLGGLDAAKLVHLATGLASVVAVFAVGRHVTGDRRSGLFAALIWAATPLVLWEMSTAYVDMFAALLATLALLAAVQWMDTRGPAYCILCGVFAGLGLGVKPNMALVGAPIYVTVLLLEVRRRRDFELWMGSGVLAVLIGLPWYLRAFVLTGNPVFPFLNGVFRSSQWSPVNENFNFDLFGMGRTPLDFALLPWRLTFQTAHFSEVPDGALGVLPLVVALAPLAIALGHNRRVRVVSVFLLVALAAWAAYAQYARYLLAALPAAAVLLGWVLGKLASSPQWPLRGSSFVVALGLGLASLPIFLASFWNVPGLVPWTVDLGRETRQAYLERALRQYGAYEWVRDNLPPGDASKILGVGFGEWPIAYSPVPVYIGHMTYAGQQILLASDGQTAVDRARAAGFRYLLIDFFPRDSRWRSSYPIAQDEVINNDLTLLYANNYVYLYALNTGPSPSVLLQDVIRDQTFAELRAGSTTAWQAFATPDPTPYPACQGVAVSRAGGYLQTFQAQPNTLYRFELEMESKSPQAASGMIEVAWKRSTNPAATINIEVEPLSQTAQTYLVGSTSPSDANEGTLYITTFDDNNVCVHRASAQMETPR